MKALILAGAIVVGLGLGFVSVAFFPHSVQAGPQDN